MTGQAATNQKLSNIPLEINKMPSVGRIVAVTGAHAIVLLDHDVGIPDEDKKSPEIGTLLKVDTEPSIALALISALSTPSPGTHEPGQELRIVEVEFIGELPKDDEGKPTSFRRGISCYPALGDIVCRANTKELAMAYACDTESSVRIGHIQQDKSIPAMVKTDELLGKHFAVLGTTGTGKSCSVALIFRRILEANPQAHVLLLDVHREYASAFKEFAEVISPANMNLPFWLLNFEEMTEIIIGDQRDRETDVEILRELIPQAKQRYRGGEKTEKTSRLRTQITDDGNIGIDTPVPYRTSDLISLLDQSLGKLELKGELAPYKRLKARIEQISRDPRYAFMFGSLTVHDTMAEILGHLFRIPVKGRPITILELGGLPSEIINVVVSVLARMAFDFGLWSGGQVPITFVCEEAHRYVPFDPHAGFEPTKRAISKIAKEGRKYGVSLCIITQRPAELDPTILSQCNTVFSMRLTNERDQEILKAGVSDAAASLMEFMPTMGTGEAITFGEGVSLPTRIKFDLLPPHALPRSSTASFSQNWSKDITDKNFLDNIVTCWRQQMQVALPENPGATNTVDTPATASAPQPVAEQPQVMQTAQPAQAAPPVQAQPQEETVAPAPQPMPQVPPQAAPQAAPPIQQQPMQATQQPMPATAPQPAPITPQPAMMPQANSYSPQPVMPPQAAAVAPEPPAAMQPPVQPPVQPPAQPVTQPVNSQITQPQAAPVPPGTSGEPSLSDLIKKIRG